MGAVQALLRIYRIGKLLVPVMGTIGRRYVILFGRDIVGLLFDRAGVNPKDEVGRAPCTHSVGMF